MTTADDVLAHHPEWYHSIELAPGRVTPGRAPLSVWQDALRSLHLPDLAGRSVLDIGAYDGFFSFSAERLGAARVVALDHYIWSADMVSYMQEWREARAAGKRIPSPHLTTHWRPAELPGKAPFDAARSALSSQVESVVGDFMTISESAVGAFDVVLFLGVLYHLEEPLSAIRRVFNLTAPGGLCVIETEAMEMPGSGSRALCEFFPGDELNNDSSNWWAPNLAALSGMCRAAGFSSVKAMPTRWPLDPLRRLGRQAKHALARVPLLNMPRRYRLVIHAYKSSS
jgi:tRNA (mo5U34)-methyltransferase